MADLASLIDHEIPEARLDLENSYNNLERVAAYCEANYLQSSDKTAALEATKRYTVQSLASVAYQINTLASNLLQMLDLQTEKMHEIEHQVNNVCQFVDIHKEKVARREIGVLAANKTVGRQHKIVAPEKPERPERYQRRKISYGLLDDIGHGVKQMGRENPVRQFLNRAGSTASAGSSSSGGSGLQPMQQHGFVQPDPSHYGPGGRFASASRSLGKDYRAPVTIAPPTAPSPGMQQRYPYLVQTGQGGERTSILAAGTGGNYATASVGRYSGSLRPGMGQFHVPASAMEPEDVLPPPPTDLMYGSQMESSPPLPPPPPIQGIDGAEWTPPAYIERVIAVYDYTASKPDELSFRENALIYVTNKNEDGWYEGVLDGLTGLFPGNYVEPV